MRALELLEASNKLLQLTKQDKTTEKIDEAKSNKHGKHNKIKVNKFKKKIPVFESIVVNNLYSGISSLSNL